MQGDDRSIHHINVFSTSEYCYLKEFYSAETIKANQIENKEEYDQFLVESGKEIYENYCSERNN